MNSLLHALNIGTLANWLSVAMFGTVAVVVPPWQPVPPAAREEEVVTVPEDFSVGEMTPAEPQASGESASAAPEEIAPAAPETLPVPPELPEIAEFSPLPEIPTLPAPAVRTQAAETPVKHSVRPSALSQKTGKPTNAARASRGTGQPGSTGSATGAASGSSDASRLAAGRMPAPSYPPAARRAGQTGTVIVEFTVDTTGRVISAHAKSSSPWPLLNDEAVRTVRRWKFPPGGVMKLQRPIVFQLR